MPTQDVLDPCSDTGLWLKEFLNEKFVEVVFPYFIMHLKKENEFDQFDCGRARSY